MLAYRSTTSSAHICLNYFRLLWAPEVCILQVNSALWCLPKEAQIPFTDLYLHCSLLNATRAVFSHFQEIEMNTNAFYSISIFFYLLFNFATCNALDKLWLAIALTYCWPFGLIASFVLIWIKHLQNEFKCKWKGTFSQCCHKSKTFFHSAWELI